ncbi:hypothetical protein COTS27_00083 [Spirochaetota bacterium]|nr:hypothetical protein COTS27_00083 [Spirochaetota bacterium]
MVAIFKQRHIKLLIGALLLSTACSLQNLWNDEPALGERSLSTSSIPPLAVALLNAEPVPAHPPLIKASPLTSLANKRSSIDPSDFATTDDFKRGATLTGRTRMGDNRMVDFKLTVLSIVKNATPATDSILAIIEDELFEKTGVLAGMSGSPVYYEDKLVGAIAYTVAFLKKPIVGITPITAMYEIVDYEKQSQTLQNSRNKDGVYNDSLRLPGYDFTDFAKKLQFSNNLHALDTDAIVKTLIPEAHHFEAVQIPSWFSKSPKSAESQAQQQFNNFTSQSSTILQNSRTKAGMMPIAMPLAVSGQFYLSDHELSMVTGMQNTLLTLGGGGGETVSRSKSRPSNLGQYSAAESPAGDDLATPPADKGFNAIIPGDLIGVNLVRGSINISAFGTVTYVGDDYLLAFGHPMNLLGTTEISLYTGFVDAVVPRLDFSYKVGRLLKEVGTIKQDRYPGILGVRGHKVPRLPVTIRLETPLIKKELDFEVIQTRPFVQQFTTLLFLNSFVQFEGLGGKTAFSYRLVLENMNGDSLELDRRLLYGSVNANIASLAKYLNLLLQTVIDNAFAETPLKSIVMEITSEDQDRFSVLDYVSYSKQPYRAGATVPFTLGYTRFQGGAYQKKFDYTLPANLEAGYYTVNIANEALFTEQDLLRHPEKYKPYDLATLFELLSFAPDQAVLVVWLTHTKTGTSLKLKNKEIYPNLPSVKRNLLLALPQTATTSLKEFIVHKQPLAEPFLGMQTFPIEIKNP